MILESGRIRRYKIVVEPELRLDLSVFCGSMIRGAIGHTLLHRYCRCGNGVLLHQDDCLYASYASLFETDGGNAFVISTPAEGITQPGESFAFHVTLLEDDQNTYTHDHDGPIARNGTSILGNLSTKFRQASA